MKAIIEYLDNYLTQIAQKSINPGQANAILASAGLLRNDKDGHAKPLRKLLRKGQLPHALQYSGKGSQWVIPHSTSHIKGSSNYSTPTQPVKIIHEINGESKISAKMDISKLKIQLEQARLKYKPDRVKYLLIAEAPPDAIERFFYYENVRTQDNLFLGVVQSLYPDLKTKFLEKKRSAVIKNEILLKFKLDGFYLLDLSEIPLSLLTGSLSAQLPALIEKVKKNADSQTRIILIKANVYDTAFYALRERFENVIGLKIPFPSSGQQTKFAIKFDEALKLAGYH